MKPEIVARGLDTVSADPFNDSGFIGVSGTSLSTPLLAAAVACLTQAHPDWTPAEMRARIMSSGDTFRDTGTFDPLMLRGFGLLDAAYVVADDCNDNGIADSIEIDAGTVADCNGNGLPDSCDIALGIEDDLDSDGVPDSCPADPCSPVDLAEPFGELDFFDVDAFLLAFAAGDSAVDFIGDGVLDFWDVSEFLVLFAAGCP